MPSGKRAQVPPWLTNVVLAALRNPLRRLGQIGRRPLIWKSMLERNEGDDNFKSEEPSCLVLAACCGGTSFFFLAPLKNPKPLQRLRQSDADNATGKPFSRGSTNGDNFNRKNPLDDVLRFSWPPWLFVKPDEDQRAELRKNKIG